MGIAHPRTIRVGYVMFMSFIHMSCLLRFANKHNILGLLQWLNYSTKGGLWETATWLDIRVMCPGTHATARWSLPDVHLISVKHWHGSIGRAESRAWQWWIPTERCRICISRWWIPNYRWRIWKVRWGSWDPAGSLKFNSWATVSCHVHIYVRQTAARRLF